MKTDVLIIGAGAAGLMCALTAGRRGRSVLVLDHGGKTGRKIHVSGGGRCNFTNLSVRPENYLSRNPRFCMSALSRFTPQDIVGMLEEHGIEYYEKEKGQLFCRRSSAEVVRMLGEECRASGVKIVLGCRVGEIGKEGLFTVETSAGVFEAESLVLATGGLSHPELGASDRGLRIARQFGLGIVPPCPALVPLLFTQGDRDLFGELSGISLDAEVRCGGKGFRGAVLFTHRGLSGPALLQASCYWSSGEALDIDLLPGRDAFGLLRENRQSRRELRSLLGDFLPKRFAQRWTEAHRITKPVCQCSDREVREIARLLHHWEIRPEGTEGFSSAEATLGGIDTDELSSKTMEARKVPGLYCVGEVVDVTGQLGGYNLHWAWASGHAAGLYA
ncbi:MAG: NAD(P)/FAD-dependent oxidoreductase [Thermodesulfovibrionales bacterium]